MVNRFVRVVPALVGLCLASCAGEADRPAPDGAETGSRSASIDRSGPTGTREAGGRAAGGGSVPERPVVAPLPEKDPDDLHRERIVGVWTQDYTGTRWLAVRPDGTATMFIDPDWVARAVIGEALTIDVEWSIEDGRALMKSVSGRPESGFKAATLLFGKERHRKITTLTDETFVLLDEEDGSESEWRRVGPGVKVPTALGEVGGKR